MRRWRTAAMATVVAALALPAGAAAAWERIDTPGRLVQLGPGAAAILDPAGAQPLQRLHRARPAAASPIVPRASCTVEAFDERRALHDCTRHAEFLAPAQFVVTRHDGTVLAEIDELALRLTEVYPSAVGSRLVELYDGTYRVEDFTYVDWRTGQLTDQPPKRLSREGHTRRLDLDRTSTRAVRDPCALAERPFGAVVRRDDRLAVRVCRSGRVVALPGASGFRTDTWRPSAFLIDYPQAWVAGRRAVWVTKRRIAMRALPDGPVTRLRRPPTGSDPTELAVSRTHLYVGYRTLDAVYAAPLP